jgi:TonB family protein
MEPVYPELARKMLIRGIVKVEVVVAPSGKAKSTHVTGGNPVLAQAALDAIEKWRWAPAPQESRELIELSFVPQRAAEETRFASGLAFGPAEGL